MAFLINQWEIDMSDMPNENSKIVNICRELREISFDIADCFMVNIEVKEKVPEEIYVAITKMTSERGDKLMHKQCGLLEDLSKELGTELY